MSFFSESIKEFEHVVFPTRSETIKYFNIVVSMIVALTIFLFVIGTVFSVGLFAAKKQITPLRPSSTTQKPASSSDLDLKGLNLGGSATTKDTSGKTSTTPIDVTPTPTK